MLVLFADVRVCPTTCLVPAAIQCCLRCVCIQPVITQQRTAAESVFIHQHASCLHYTSFSVFYRLDNFLLCSWKYCQVIFEYLIYIQWARTACRPAPQPPCWTSRPATWAQPHVRQQIPGTAATPCRAHLDTVRDIVECQVLTCSLWLRGLAHENFFITFFALVLVLNRISFVLKRKQKVRKTVL